MSDETQQATESGVILGVNVRQYPSPDGCSPLTLAVLVSGACEDYACYVGHGSTEFVARGGDKISFNEAAIHFPGIQAERYRE